MALILNRSGLLHALSITTGSIIGGSILLISGKAILVSGPLALLALLFATLIALITACSFAELSTAFPESGGMYTFAKKVIGVQSAFSVGWIILLARVMISALYVKGFSSFTMLLFQGAPGFQNYSPNADFILSIGIVGLTVFPLVFNIGGSGTVLNILKLVLFAGFLSGGFLVLSGMDPVFLMERLSVTAHGGISGVFEATGYLFVTVQGFAVIVAVAGEVKNPTRNLPRAMFLSILFAFVLYAGILTLVILAGFPADSDVKSFAAIDPSSTVVRAFEVVLGPLGAKVVVISGILSMFLAMIVNLRAAGKLVVAMSIDRAFPVRFSVLNKLCQPSEALLGIALSLVLLVVTIPDVETSGASASLVFLLTFALTQGIAILFRNRVAEFPGRFRTPFFPLLPIAGIVLCLLLAVYQGYRAPLAGLIVTIWLTFGAFLYWFQFAGRARVVDAGSEATNPELIKYRGRSPLFLIPVANPAKVTAILSVAKTLIPPDVGRLLLLAVAKAPKEWSGISYRNELAQANAAVTEALETAFMKDMQAEAIVSVAPDPWMEFERIARNHRCDGIVLGMSGSVSESFDKNVVRLVNTVPSNVLFLKAPDNWRMPDYAEILVPTAGRSDHSELRARLFGSFARNSHHRISFFSVISPETTPDREQEIFQELHSIMLDEFPVGGTVELTRATDIAGAILKRASHVSLIVLGMPRSHDGRKIIGPLIQAVIEQSDIPVLLISKRDE